MLRAINKPRRIPLRIVLPLFAPKPKHLVSAKALQMPKTRGRSII
jgi:hypothetical protein